MNDILAQSNTASMRAHWHAKLGGHEHDAENLVDTSHAARIYLTHVNSIGLEQLLEDHAVVGVLAGRDADAVRLQLFADASVTENVILRSWNRAKSVGVRSRWRG